MSCKLGIGSLSIVLVLLAILWSCNMPFLDGICLGDQALSSFGLSSWSNGTTGIHYTVFYGLLLLIPAFILGIRNPSDLFATAGKWVSGIMIVFFIIIFFFMAF